MFLCTAKVSLLGVKNIFVVGFQQRVVLSLKGVYMCLL